MSDEKTRKSSKLFSKGNGPHKNPYANPSSEKLKTIRTHLLPETDLEKQFSEKTFYQRENSGGMSEK